MTNNTQFVILVCMAFGCSVVPIIIALMFMIMKLAIMKVILDGLKSVLWDYNNRRY